MKHEFLRFLYAEYSYFPIWPGYLYRFRIHIELENLACLSFVQMLKKVISPNQTKLTPVFQ